jgi:hypothetical protein
VDFFNILKLDWLEIALHDFLSGFTENVSYYGKDMVS